MSSDNKSLYSNLSYKSINELHKDDPILCRMEFIKYMFRDSSKLKILFDNRGDVKQNGGSSGELNKGKHNFNTIMKELYGNKFNFSDTFEYITSGSTGHTFKGLYKDIDGEKYYYAMKVCAYTKQRNSDNNYGNIDDIARPENAEIAMLKLLSQFATDKQTFNIILPMATFNTDIKLFINLLKDGIIGNIKEYKDYCLVMDNYETKNINEKAKNKLIKNFKFNKYYEFVRKYENGEFYEQVSILFSEWANRGDFLNFCRERYKKYSIAHWRIFFFQILYILTLIQNKYPDFRHNDLKANNILIHKIENMFKRKSSGNRIHYDKINIGDLKFEVPDIGYYIKLWDFDFACIPNIVNNNKVSAKWTNNINVKPEKNRYYDVHFFFHTLLYFIPEFNDEKMTYIPNEVRDFIYRIVPEKYRFNKRLNNPNLAKRGGGGIQQRLFINDEYMTPYDILKNDPFFSRYRITFDRNTKWIKNKSDEGLSETMIKYINKKNNKDKKRTSRKNSKK